MPIEDRELADSSHLLNVSFNLFVGCTGALGMASGEIKDYQLTASSSYSEAPPTQARAGEYLQTLC